MIKKKIAILGSTGSIGKNSLDVINTNRKKFKILLLSANTNYSEIIRQIKKYKPKFFVISNFVTFQKIKRKFQNKKTIILNEFSRVPIKLKFDITIAAIVGIAGLEPTIQFTKNSKKILLANKESIICGWHIISNIIKKKILKLSQSTLSTFQYSNLPTVTKMLI